MSSVKPSYFTVPVDLARYVYANKHYGEFGLYLYLKSICNGLLYKKSLDFDHIKSITGISSRKTFNKYINNLIELNWVGYDPEFKRYFIRGFKVIRLMNGLKGHTGAVVQIIHLSKIKNVLESIIIGSDIKKQEFARKKAIRKRIGEAAFIKGCAKQANSILPDYPTYHGKSNKGLGVLLGCSQSQANRIKLEAKKNKFIKTKKHFKVISTIIPPATFLRSFMPNSHKITARKRRQRGKTVVQILEQLYDEIIPNFKFKRIKKIVKKGKKEGT